MTDDPARAASAEPVRACKWCSNPAKDDSDLCARHHEKQKGYQRKAMKALRATRRRRRVCLWCPKPAKPGSRLCVGCEIRHEQRRVKEVVKERRDRSAARTEVVTEGDGRTRNRYVGRHHGKPSNAEMDAWDLNDIASAIQRCRDGLAIARSPENIERPRIQRDDAIRAALSHADLARRFLEEMLERHRYHRNVND